MVAPSPVLSLSGKTIRACTGVYVDKDLTEDGTTLFGRTEDLEKNQALSLVYLWGSSIIVFFFSKKIFTTSIAISFDILKIQRERSKYNEKWYLY